MENHRFCTAKDEYKIFERFRKACDEFFRKKGDFFKSLKEGMNVNLDKKRALCEKAEALKDSTDWKATADELTKLQKEWNNRSGSKEIFRCNMEALHFGLRLLL